MPAITSANAPLGLCRFAMSRAPRTMAAINAIRKRRLTFGRRSQLGSKRSRAHRYPTPPSKLATKQRIMKLHPWNLCMFKLTAARNAARMSAARASERQYGDGSTGSFYALQSSRNSAASKLLWSSARQAAGGFVGLRAGASVVGPFSILRSFGPAACRNRESAHRSPRGNFWRCSPYAKFVATV